AESGYASIMQTLKADPLLHLGLRLGEGTGAAMALFVMRSAAAIFNEMATFSGAGVCKA
ncbi:MAG: nicotinate-nucleotide--dimethylbenzimidazole phosphoribosyltransferase, partial [Desulfocurvibacter africanus]